MSERSEYAPGEFCWVDLASPDTDASAKFYGDLLGWKAEPGEAAHEDTGGYGFFRLGDKLVAGYGPMQEGGHPVWMSYVNVTDADETTRKIKDAGGTMMMEPFDVPGDSGRMAVFQDAEGAFLSIWEAKSHHGAELVNEVGAWTWNQLATRDLDGARRFYGEVFGWTLEPAKEAPPDAPYFMWHAEGQKWEEGLGAAVTMGDDVPADTPPYWLVYLDVEDADQSARQTEEAGGEVMLPPLDIGVGRLAVLRDPHGAAFAIIRSDYDEER